MFKLKKRPSQGRKNAAQKAYQRATASGVYVDIDLRPLARAFSYLSKETLDKGMVRGLNKGMDRANTLFVRELQRDTGIRRQTRIRGRITKIPATANRLEAKLLINRRYLSIDKKDFGAKHKWSNQYRMNSRGVKHQAWEGGKLTKKSFLIKSRPDLPAMFGLEGRRLRAVYGPSLAREVARKRPKYAGILRKAVRSVVLTEVRRNYRDAEKRAKAKFGL